MRILQVNSASSLGGAETHVLELTSALRNRGHKVVVAGRTGGPVQAEVHLPFFNSADVYSAFRLRQFLNKNPFDIVHAHLARDYTVVIAAVIDLPVGLVFTRHLLYPIRGNPLYNRVDGWIAPTTQILKTLAPLHPRRAEVIPNWVDVEKFKYRPHPPHRPIQLGLLGQIAPHKGHEDAISALRILGPDYRLMFAGAGEDSYVGTLKKLSRDLDVEFAGFAEPSAFFERIDVLLAPSWEEPFGIVLLEAMASGIPVIATAAGGPLDIIRADIHGLLVPPRNPQALADAIRSLNGDRRQGMIQHARERVETEFDIRKVTPKVEDFYRTIGK
jgi:glycosyltransferase involved in cell wall biosynthesis